MDYDYYEAVKDDVLQYIKDNINLADFDSAEELEEYLNECSDLWCADAVTGNGSGSYTYSRYKAEEYLCHNQGLLAEAMINFGCDITFLNKGAEACDVLIRCYVLPQAIHDAVQSLDYDFSHSAERQLNDLEQEM
ncbi:MAG: hypothetical protein LUH82_07245 [Clostridiales bacterium]|nr:hypothetical protein [Clostridiales bacterium]